MRRVYKEYTDQLVEAVNAVCTPLYAQMFEKVAKEQPIQLANEENYVLAHCPNEVTWYVGDKRQEIIERIRDTHLKWFLNWFREENTGRPPYVKWNSIMMGVILHLKNLLFRIDRGDVITNDKTRDTFQQLADATRLILVHIKESNPKTIDQSAISLVRELLQILFYITLDTDLNMYLKSLNLIDIITALIDASGSDTETHFQAYKILAAIMVDSDIKKSKNANRIVTVFINTIKSNIDRGDSTRDRLHNALRCIKVLTQHDEIREELIKQEGYLLFFRCALEDEFDTYEAKPLALEVLLALTFNADFAALVKQNVEFMSHMRNLTKSERQELRRVADALIWKLEKESEVSAKKVKDQLSSTSASTISQKRHDITMSYSHKDKDLCYSIRDRLEKDHFTVWIDSKDMHGDVSEAMAKAIENTEFVLVCMSDAYKQSPYCKMEVNYAVTCKRQLIPLVMIPDYKADGWLGLITSGIIRIDFPKFDFDKAYAELKKQIELYRINDSHSTTMKQDQIHHNPSSMVDVAPNTLSRMIGSKEPRPVVEYPHCIDMWTEEHVKSFLLDKELNSLLSAFKGMNGFLLHQAYDMCQSNRQAMFSSLKEDTTRSQHITTFTLKDYLTFLNEIKAYVPYKTGDPLNPTSTVCNLMRLTKNSIKLYKGISLKLNGNNVHLSKKE